MAKTPTVDLQALLDTLTDEQKLKLIESFNKQLGIESPDKKQPRKPVDTGKDYVNDPDVKKYSEVSQILQNNKTSSTAARPPVNMVKVYCKNCGKGYEVNATFPNINDFVCCRK